MNYWLTGGAFLLIIWALTLVAAYAQGRKDKEKGSQCTKTQQAQ